MRTLVAAAGVVVSLASAVPVLAQSPWRAERPYRGLFGSGFGETSQQLTATFRVGAGIDNNILLASGVRDVSRTDLTRSARGSFGLGSAGLGYSLQRGSFGFGASVSAATRYYGKATADDFVSSASSGVTASYRIKNTQFSASSGLSFQPYNLLSLSALPEVNDTPALVGGPPDEELVISPTRYRSYRTTASVTQQYTLGRRGSIDLGYNYRRADTSRAGIYWGQGARGRYTHRIVRDVNAYAGYRYDEYWYPTVGDDSERTPIHSFDLGVDVNRALSRSLSRWVTVTVTTGTSAIMRSSQVNARARYMVHGTARVSREFGRTWNAAMTYRRGVVFIETFNQPFLYDGLSASVGGLFSTRLRFTAGAETTLGQVGTTGRNPYDSYRAHAALTMALTRFAAAGVSYGFSHFKFSGDTVLPPGSLSRADRHGAQVFLTTWVPLYSRARRPDATR